MTESGPQGSQERDTDTYDVVVIGGGPAGENAAQYAIEGTGLTAVAWNYSSLLVIRFLFGAGEAGAFPGMLLGGGISKMIRNAHLPAADQFHSAVDSAIGGVAFGAGGQKCHRLTKDNAALRHANSLHGKRCRDSRIERLRRCIANILGREDH